MDGLLFLQAEVAIAQDVHDTNQLQWWNSTQCDPKRIHYVQSCSFQPALYIHSKRNAMMDACTQTVPDSVVASNPASHTIFAAISPWSFMTAAYILLHHVHNDVNQPPYGARTSTDSMKSMHMLGCAGLPDLIHSSPYTSHAPDLLCLDRLYNQYAVAHCGQ